MDEIFNPNRKTQFILNPNCSELVSAIELKNQKDFKALMEELLKITEAKIYLSLEKGDTVHLEAQKDSDGITRLIFLPNVLRELKVYSDSFIKIDARIQVPLDYLKLDDNLLDVDSDKAGLVIKKVLIRLNDSAKRPLPLWASEALSTDRADYLEDERMLLRFDEARLDLSGMQSFPSSRRDYYCFEIEAEGLNFLYDSKKHLDLFEFLIYDSILYTMNTDVDYDLYPALRKIFRPILNNYKTHFFSHDGGTSKHWEKWCAYNFADYYMEAKKTPDFEYGTFYLLPLKSLNDFKCFIEDLASFGMITIFSNENTTRIESSKIDRIIFEEHGCFLIYEGAQHILDRVLVVPKELDFSQFEEVPAKLYNHGDYFEIHAYPKGESDVSSFDQVTFFIYLSGDHRWSDYESNNTFISYLENHSTRVEI